MSARMRKTRRRCHRWCRRGAHIRATHTRQRWQRITNGENINIFAPCKTLSNLIIHFCLCVVFPLTLESFSYFPPSFFIVTALRPLVHKKQKRTNTTYTNHKCTRKSQRVDGMECGGSHPDTMLSLSSSVSQTIFYNLSSLESTRFSWWDIHDADAEQVHRNVIFYFRENSFALNIFRLWVSAKKIQLVTTLERRKWK